MKALTSLHKPYIQSKLKPNNRLPANQAFRQRGLRSEVWPSPSHHRPALGDGAAPSRNHRTGAGFAEEQLCGRSPRQGTSGGAHTHVQVQLRARPASW